MVGKLKYHALQVGRERKQVIIRAKTTRYASRRDVATRYRWDLKAECRHRMSRYCVEMGRRDGTLRQDVRTGSRDGMSRQGSLDGIISRCKTWKRERSY